LEATIIKGAKGGEGDLKVLKLILDFVEMKIIRKKRP